MGLRGAPVNAGVGTADRQRAVTPNDGTDLPLGVAAGLRVMVGGTVSVLAENDALPVSWDVPDYGFIDVRTKRVYATGTTATGIIALYN